MMVLKHLCFFVLLLSSISVFSFASTQAEAKIQELSSTSADPSSTSSSSASTTTTQSVSSLSTTDTTLFSSSSSFRSSSLRANYTENLRGKLPWGNPPPLPPNRPRAPHNHDEWSDDWSDDDTSDDYLYAPYSFGFVPLNATEPPPLPDGARGVVPGEVNQVAVSGGAHGSAVNATLVGGPGEGKPLKEGVKETEKRQRRRRRRVRKDAASGFQKQILDAHNKIRKEGGLSPFTWSTALYDNAKAWSNEQKKNCKTAHTPTGKRYNVAGFSSIGENVWGCTGCSTPPNGNSPVNYFNGERHCYRYGPIGGNIVRSSSDCVDKGVFHFTQITWATTKQIGCEYALCKKSGQTQQTVIVTCQYGPAGNIYGRYPFTEEIARKYFPDTLKDS